MADVRSLLRQQRAARRIDHPHAAYSDAGKLLCLVCHEPIKADSLWDAHIRSSSHRLKAENLKPKPKQQQQQRPASASATAEDLAHSSHKRKYSDNGDEDLEDAQDSEDAARKKRSRADIQADIQAAAADSDVSMASPSTSSNNTRRGEGGDDGSVGRKTPQSQTALSTPPLTRRTSNTPVQGVEMQIPSRPATPNPPRDGTTPTGLGIGGMRHSPLIPQEPAAASTPSSSSKTTAGFATVSTTAALAAIAETPTTTRTAAAARGSATTGGSIDEAEWAAFEAELVNGPSPAAGSKPTINGTDPVTAAGTASDAVITAAPMSADQVASAARSEEEERAKRRAAADAQLEDEREEATRALEAEFEEMEELEARVRRLKERREALRLQAGGGGAAAGTTAGSTAETSSKKVPSGKENVESGVVDGEEEDNDEDEDDWDSFRFRK